MIWRIRQGFGRGWMELGRIWKDPDGCGKDLEGFGWIWEGLGRIRMDLGNIWKGLDGFAKVEQIWSGSGANPDIFLTFQHISRILRFPCLLMRNP